MRTVILRALDWEDYEMRMREVLLRLHYGAVNLKAGAGAARHADGAGRLFQGRSRSPRNDQMARRGHVVPAEGLARIVEDLRQAQR